MKTDFKKHRMIDYRYKSGIIGQYKGHDVYVIPEKDFNIEESRQDSSLLYALSSLERDNLRLVSGGMWIGSMTPEGYVEMYEKSKFFDEAFMEDDEPLAADIFASTMGEEEIEEDRDRSKDEGSSTSGVNPIDEYLAGETLADRFLKGLKF